MLVCHPQRWRCFMPQIQGMWSSSVVQAQELTEISPGTPKGDQPSEIPPVFYWALWIPAFFVLVYMLAQLFGPRGSPTAHREDESPE